MAYKEIVLPTPEEFFLQKGLYEPFSIGDEFNYDVLKQILALEFFDDSIKTYCPECRCESIFRTDLIKEGTLLTHTTRHIREYSRAGKRYIASSPKSVLNTTDRSEQTLFFFDRTFTLEFFCTHKHSHRIFFTFNITNGILQKIGQYPSIANSLEEKIKIYKKELGKDKGEEFSKAIGLFSHGIGIGAFVYLRRIFEGFIHEAKEQAISDGSITEDDFSSKRMVEKIELLKDYLPSVIVEHKTYYGVVSKGIHELSENECKEYFNVLRNGIELILDEKIAKKEAQRKKEAFTKGLSVITQQVNS